MRTLAAFGLAAALGVILHAPAFAGSLEVAPTTIDVKPGARSASLYLTNNGTQPIMAQVQGYGWSQDEAGEHLDPSDALAISPPMTKLLPNQRQIVRLAVKPGDANAERSFRLIVSELPDPSVPQDASVHVLLQFRLPVFAAVAGEADADLAWTIAADATGLTLHVHNGGARHAKLIAPVLVREDGRRVAFDNSGLVYVLPGASRRWPIATGALKPGETVHMAGRDEMTGAALNAPIAVPR
jgi:fimbrial chaperone protein